MFSDSDRSIADFEAGDAATERFDLSDGLVADDESRLHRVLSLENVHVRPADGRERDLQQSLPGTGYRLRYLSELDLPFLDENGGLHR